MDVGLWAIIVAILLQLGELIVVCRITITGGTAIAPLRGLEAIRLPTMVESSRSS
jgi:hypothetical protein